MELGIGINLNLGAGGRAGFSPASIAPQIWLDPSDLATMFQDTAAATPVAAANDPVGRINNKGSLGGSLQQATAANRPLYQTAFPRLEFDGVNDSLASAATLNLSAFAQIGFALLVINPSAAGTVPWSHGRTDTATGLDVLLSAGGTANTRLETFTSAVDQLETNAGTFGNGTTQVITCQTWDITQAAAANKMPFRINGAVPAKAAGGDTGAAGTVFGNNLMYLATNPAIGVFFSAKFLGLIIKGGGFSAAELAAVETWLGAKAGLTI